TPARLTQFDQRLDADEAPLVILQARGDLLAFGYQGIDPLPQKHDVLAVLDDLREQAHAGTLWAKSSATASASCGWLLNHCCVSRRTRARKLPSARTRSLARTSASPASIRVRDSRTWA